MRALLCAAVLVVAGLLCPSHAGARPEGIVTGDCSACHGASSAAIVEVTTSPVTFQPGDEVTFSVAVRAEQGTAQGAGVFVGLPSHGEVFTLPDGGLTFIDGMGFVHSRPMDASGGVATFRFGYRAPAEAGGVTLGVAALATNADGRRSGDAPGSAHYLGAFGCDGVTHYTDLDRDGYGSAVLEQSIGCDGVTPPEGFALASGDCNENSATIHPNATELCNRKDDDCDGMVDEDSVPVELFPDPDGDGYYGLDAGESTFGCVGLRGYAADGGDCMPDDAAVSPAATEVCNGTDDDCDGQTDERVRPQCGVGWCARASDTCEEARCTPGEPRPEICNLFDDDCNGIVDDGTPCAAGHTCIAGSCVVDGAGGAASGTGGATGASGSGASSGGNLESGGTGNAGSAGQDSATGGMSSGPGGTADARGPQATGCGLQRVHTESSRSAWLLWILLFAYRSRRGVGRSREVQLPLRRSLRQRSVAQRIHRGPAPGP